MLEDFLVGLLPVIAIVAGIGAGVIAMYFRSKKHREEQQTIRMALEKGIELPENIFRKVEQESSDLGNGSLKRGIFWTCVGVALFIALWVNTHSGLDTAVWALIPLSIGIGSLIHHFLTKNK